eukprot:scaffold44277_cov20-Tisochrysis_lutea.AAC.2
MPFHDAVGRLCSPMGPAYRASHVIRVSSIARYKQTVLDAVPASSFWHSAENRGDRCKHVQHG